VDGFVVSIFFKLGFIREDGCGENLNLRLSTGERK
jgi:hypothetical protein